MPALPEPASQPEAPEPDPLPIFHIFRNSIGRWCALSDDGMVLGIFFLRDAAIRFARDEGEDRGPLLLLPDNEDGERLPAQKVA